MGRVAAQLFSDLYREVRLGSSVGSGWDTQGHSETKPLLCCLGCVLRVIVLLEGEYSPQSEVLSNLEQVFIKIFLYFAPFIFPSILTRLPVPAAEKHPHRMMLPPPFFTIGMVPGFLQMWRFAFWPKRSILVSSDQRILFLMVWESFSKIQAGCHVPFTEEWLPSGQYHKGLIGGVLQRWSFFWKILPSPQRNSGALSEWPLGSWSPLLCQYNSPITEAVCIQPLHSQNFPSQGS